MDDATNDTYLSSGETNTGVITAASGSLNASRNHRGSQSINVSRSSDEPGADDSDSSELKSLPLKTKRRGQEKPKPQANRKRAWKAYNDKYRVLLNEVISHAASGIETDGSTVLPPSQLGATVWSLEEKQRFFSALDRLGRHNIRGLATAIGTKSEPEVQVYSQLLFRSLADHHVHGGLNDLVQLTAVPAAFEIGQECDLALEEAADALSKRQFDHDIHVEKGKHDVWLLNKESANDLSKNVISDEGIAGNALELSKATDLLDLEVLLELSELIFMNSSRWEENWRSYAKNEETPSIFTTAFLDFYNLVLSITRRLVQSALYTALSRHRAVKFNGNMPSRIVRKEDVSVALKVLGAVGNWKQYWAKVARRCNLRVSHKIQTRKQRKARLRYSEVEKDLMQTSASEEDSSISSSDNETSTTLAAGKKRSAAQSRTRGQSEEQGVSTAWSSSSDPIQEEVHFIPSRFINRKKRLKNMRYHEKAEDAYTQAYDVQESRSEEQRLWTMLGKQPLTAIKLENNELPKRPLAKRKDPEDLIDWRHHLQYKSPWERYSTPVMMEEFRCNKRLYKRARADDTTERITTETEVEDYGDARGFGSNMEYQVMNVEGKPEEQTDEEEEEEEGEEEEEEEEDEDDVGDEDNDEDDDDEDEKASNSNEDSDIDSQGHNDSDDGEISSIAYSRSSAKLVSEKEQEGEKEEEDDDEEDEDEERHLSNSHEDEDEDEDTNSDFPDDTQRASTSPLPSNIEFPI